MVFLLLGLGKRSLFFGSCESSAEFVRREGVRHRHISERIREGSKFCLVPRSLLDPTPGQGKERVRSHALPASLFAVRVNL